MGIWQCLFIISSSRRSFLSFLSCEFCDYSKNTSKNLYTVNNNCLSVKKKVLVFTMPRVKSQNPKSLKKLCAEFVASNLDYWCNPSSEDERNKCDQEATLSQFDKLRKW